MKRCSRPTYLDTEHAPTNLLSIFTYTYLARCLDGNSWVLTIEAPFHYCKPGIDLFSSSASAHLEAMGQNLNLGHQAAASHHWFTKCQLTHHTRPHLAQNLRSKTWSTQSMRKLSSQLARTQGVNRSKIQLLATSIQPVIGSNPINLHELPSAQAIATQPKY